jgi:hypothetical protein
VARASGWGESGDFDRCVVELSKYVKPCLTVVKGLCSNLHKMRDRCDARPCSRRIEGLTDGDDHGYGRNDAPDAGGCYG